MDEDGVLMVFRCHNKMELAEKRCPAGAEPGVCAYGYEGSVCDGCIEGYGMYRRHVSASHAKARATQRSRWWF